MVFRASEEMCTPASVNSKFYKPSMDTIPPLAQMSRHNAYLGRKCRYACSKCSTAWSPTTTAFSEHGCIGTGLWSESTQPQNALRVFTRSVGLCSEQLAYACRTCGDIFTTDQDAAYSHTYSCAPPVGADEAKPSTRERPSKEAKRSRPVNAEPVPMTSIAAVAA